MVLSSSARAITGLHTLGCHAQCCVLLISSCIDISPGMSKTDGRTTKGIPATHGCSRQRRSEGSP